MQQLPRHEEGSLEPQRNVPPQSKSHGKLLPKDKGTVRFCTRPCHKRSYNLTTYQYMETHGVLQVFIEKFTVVGKFDKVPLPLSGAPC
jgi:hypothetical protein